MKIIKLGGWCLCCLLMSCGVYAASVTVKHFPHYQKSLSSVININTADVKTLGTVKGIGKKKAAAIVAYRKQHGNYASLNDLANVKGISKKAVVKLQKKNPGKLTVGK